MVQPARLDPESEAAMALKKSGWQSEDYTDGMLNDGEKKARALNVAARIDIPCDNRVRLRYYAEILRSLAYTLDLASRNTEIPERLLLLGVKQDVYMAHRKIRNIARPSGQV